MKRWLGIIAFFFLAAVVVQSVGAQELLSRPDIPNYEPDRTPNASARSLAAEYLDVAVLLIALGLASYFAIVNRSRKGMFGLTVFSMIWFGFLRQGCVCSIGAIQNVSLAAFDPSYAVPIGVVAFFSLPLLFTLFFGRTFCAAVCPLGAIQEVVAQRPIKIPRWLEQSLGLLPYVYLGAAVLFAATGTAFIICEYDPFIAIFRLSGSVNMLILGACFLVIGFFVGRPYCRFLCPYGAVLGLLAKVSKWHLRIPPEECIVCKLCEDSCPYGAIHEPTVDQAAPERLRGRRRLVGLLSLLPVLVGMGAAIGYGLAIPVSKLNADVRLAEQVRLEETGQVEGTIDATDAFYNTGRPREELYAEVIELRSGYNVVGILLGAWVGFVIGAKLLHLGVRRRRTEYLPEPLDCVSCGRCFWYCPNEQVRLGLIDELPVLVKEN